MSTLTPDIQIARFGHETKTQETLRPVKVFPVSGEVVVRLFEVQAEERGEEVAVEFGGEELSYGELNRRANQLAHRLRGLGVGPEVLVGVCLERSLEMVVALLGVLKAGGAYVPIDPSYPDERVRFMLADAQVPVLISQEGQRTRLAGSAAQLVCIDGQGKEIAGERDDNPRSGVGWQNLAYVIYTSGSTGKPKGAMNHHGGIRNRLLWMQEQYKLDSTDKILQKTPFSFDVSVWEFFWPLITGARLIMARPRAQGDGDYLAQVIAERKVTTIHFVPSMLAAFLQGRHEDKCSSLRRVICSGEALSTEVAREFLAHFSAELHNLYGPTEAAVDVTYWKCEREHSASTIPIGKPIANIQMHILDDNLFPVPIGIAGEVYIAGEGLGRGYWQRPDLTAERFLPNPFAIQSGARLYWTGDQGRYRADGTIEFLGRLDHQIKIRGFRIELGEIEAALGQHPEVLTAVVVADQADTIGLRLIAYWVPFASESDRKLHAGCFPTVGQLRDYLHARLPDYMVPSAWVEMTALPLTPNGKLDRRALPVPGVVRPELLSNFVKPRNDTESAIAGVWSDLLGFKQIGVNDNFFELGGHSLLAATMQRRLLEVFGRHISLVDIFRHPTISELSLNFASGGNESNAVCGTETTTGEDRAAIRTLFMTHRSRSLPDTAPRDCG